MLMLLLPRHLHGGLAAIEGAEKNHLLFERSQEFGELRPGQAGH